MILPDDKPCSCGSTDNRFDADDLDSLFGDCEYMASFHAYLDDSGTHDTAPWTVVGGAIGSKSSWQSLTNQWQAVLARFKVPDFHASDLQRFHDQYDGWDESKRRQFIALLLKIIEKERLTVIWCAVEQGMYKNIASDFPEFQVTPYQFCCEMCIQVIRFVAEKRKSILPIAVTFEEGQRVNSPFMMNLILPGYKTIQRQRALGIRQLNFVSEYIPPLQVADFIAYEFAKEFARPRFGDRPPRYTFLQLCKLDKYRSMGVLSNPIHVRSHFEIMKKYWPEGNWPVIQMPALWLTDTTQSGSSS